jgi:hypothetical protein
MNRYLTTPELATRYAKKIIPFTHKGFLYRQVTDLVNSPDEYHYEKAITKHKWIPVPTTMELEIAFMFRKSTRLI